jgi:hypothetical protein
MIQIEDKLISKELVTNAFVCDLEKCKGDCCIAGDVGAPLDEEETSILEKIYPKVKKYLTAEGAATIEANGKWVYTEADGLSTPMMPNQGACAYTIWENNIAKCGIEKAYNDGKIAFKKPISCHLYPIRISKNKLFEVLNYHRWSVCKAACTLGKKLNIPVYKFLKDAIVRKYGIDFYDQLDATANYLNKPH